MNASVTAWFLVNELLLAPDPSIGRLARDAPSAIWNLIHHVCDVTLHNLPSFDVYLRVSELLTLPCDVMFTYQTRHVLCPKMQ